MTQPRKYLTLSVSPPARVAVQVTSRPCAVGLTRPPATVTVTATGSNFNSTRTGVPRATRTRRPVLPSGAPHRASQHQDVIPSGTCELPVSTYAAGGAAAPRSKTASASTAELLAHIFGPAERPKKMIRDPES